jgi:hypothetical protein
MECLRGEHGVDRAVGKRNISAVPAEGLHLRADPLEKVAHRVSRLDCDDAVVPRAKKACELAGTRAQIEHGCRARQARKLDRGARPARPPALVVVGPPVAASGGHIPGRCRQATEP